jgi:hypothetical protein
MPKGAIADRALKICGSGTDQLDFTLKLLDRL